MGQKRRKVLKALAAGTTLSTAGVVSGDDDRDSKGEFEEIVEKAAQISDKEERSSFLAENDVSFANDETTLKVHGSDEKIAPDQIEDPAGEGIDLEIWGLAPHGVDSYAVWLDVSYYFAWECTYDPADNGWEDVSSGSDPQDAAALTWGSNTEKWWDIRDRFDLDKSTLTTGYNDWEDGSFTTSGAIGYRVNDKGIYESMNISNQPPTIDCHIRTLGEREEQCSAKSTMGVYLDPVGDYEPSEREVQAVFTHAWTESSTEPSLSIGMPPSLGIALEPVSEIDQKDTQTGENPDGEGNLLLTQEQITNQ